MTIFQAFLSCALWQFMLNLGLCSVDDGGEVCVRVVQLDALGDILPG